jgi:hypothetical protein
MGKKSEIVHRDLARATRDNRESRVEHTIKLIRSFDNARLQDADNGAGASRVVVDRDGSCCCFSDNDAMQASASALNGRGRCRRNVRGPEECFSAHII